MLNVLYALSLIVPFPFWFLMIVLPRTAFTKRAMSSYIIFVVLGVYYVVMLASTVISLAGAISLEFNSFITVEGLAKLMGTPIGALIVWSHMVIMDLIGGHWMYHEAQRLNAPIWWSSVCLLMTLLSGPVGLFLFISWRTWRISVRPASTHA
jgi:hypothetical protein